MGFIQSKIGDCYIANSVWYKGTIYVLSQTEDAGLITNRILLKLLLAQW